MLAPSPKLGMQQLFEKGGASTLARQQGVVLIVSLIILVALTIAGIALVRSVDTSNIIAGNIAFQQSALHSGDSGAEDAIAKFIEKDVAKDNLFTNHLEEGYAATTQVGGKNPVSQEEDWNNTIQLLSVTRSVKNKTCGGGTCTLPPDAAGNIVTYAIQRLCQFEGDPLLAPTGCASGKRLAALVGGSLSSGSSALPQATQYYYRITSRIDGPRNTLTYIQTIVAR